MQSLRDYLTIENPYIYFYKINKKDGDFSKLAVPLAWGMEKSHGQILDHHQSRSRWIVDGLLRPNERVPQPDLRDARPTRRSVYLMEAQWVYLRWVHRVVGEY